MPSILGSLGRIAMTVPLDLRTLHYSILLSGSTRTLSLLVQRYSVLFRLCPLPGGGASLAVMILND